MSGLERDVNPGGQTESDWSQRQRDWQRKLGRLRLGVEPIADQVERYRRVTWGLTLVPTGIGLIILAIFTAFRRPELGLGLAAVLFAPVVALAWWDFRKLKRNAAAYEAERAAHEGRE